MVSVLASSAVDLGFEYWERPTKDNEMPILGLLFQWATVRGQNYWNDNGAMVHHLDVNVSRIYRNARFIWYKQELQTL
jgi:hypothetical protein